MQNVLLTPCSMADFPHLIPILENYADIFDYQQRRLILQNTTKVLEEEPQNPTVYVAKHEGQEIGFLSFRRNHDDPSQFTLVTLVVKRGYQGQGVGTKLFQYGLAALKNLGASAIHTYLKFSYSPAARNFYKQLGFKQQLDDHYDGSSDQNDILYVKQLT